MNWEIHRRNDGTIDLLSAWKEANKRAITFTTPKCVEAFFVKIEGYQPVRSRQVAAMVLALADERYWEEQINMRDGE